MASPCYPNDFRPAPPALAVASTPQYESESRAAIAISVIASGGVGPYTYLWQVEEAPPGSSGGTIADPTAASTTYTPDMEGSYTLSCAVTDSLSTVVPVYSTVVCGVEGLYRVLMSCDCTALATADWSGDGEKTASDGSKWQVTGSATGTVAKVGPTLGSGIEMDRSAGVGGVHLGVGIEAADYTGYDEHAEQVYQAIIEVSNLDTAGTVNNADAFFASMSDQATAPFGTLFAYNGMFNKSNTSRQVTADVNATTGIEQAEISATLAQRYRVQVVRVGSLRRTYFSPLGAAADAWWDPSSMSTSRAYYVQIAGAARSTSDPSPGTASPTLHLDVYRHAASGRQRVFVRAVRLLQVEVP